VNGPVWVEFNTQLLASLAAESLVLPSSPDPAPSPLEFHLLDWALLTPGRERSSDRTFKWAENGKINCNNFTAAELDKVAKKFPTPDPDHPHTPLLFIGQYFVFIFSYLG
jgi:hypothetical protein